MIDNDNHETAIATEAKVEAKANGRKLPPGIYLRGNTFWICYYRDGRRYRESADSDKKTIATKLLQRRHTEAASGKPIGPEVEKTTLSDLQGILLDHYRMNGRRSTRRVAEAFDHLLAHFDPSSRANAITGDRINHYIVERQEQGAANATINRELAALKRAFHLAHRVGRVAAIPFITMLAEDNARQGFAEAADFDAIHALLPEHLRDPLRFLYLSGWRTGEMKSLEWRDVYADAIRLRSENSKNGKGRELPLLGELAAILDRARANRRLDCPHVFHHNGNQLRDFRGSWASACAKAGHTHLLVHDLRRSAIRNMTRAGVGERIAMAISGHKTRSTFDRYNITTGDDLRHAVAAVQDFLSNQPAESRVTSLRPATAEAK
jgi:integrase